MYLAEKIGEEFKKWMPGNVILITAPTGAGKSYFIQREYLKWMIKERKGKILYLVNRKILKKQMEDGLKEAFYEMREELRAMGIMVRELADNYSVVVYDECHYYSADSTFNTSTELSYNFLRQIFDRKIQIYMSATMESVSGKIKEDCIQNSFLPNFQKPVWYITQKNYIAFRNKTAVDIKDDYVVPKNYDYIDTRCINKLSDEGGNNEKTGLYKKYAERGVASLEKERDRRF